MWLPVSTLATLCVLLKFPGISRQENQDLELVFRERSQTDWRDAWHKEKYSRCREKLIRHLYWACEKDIYRLTRRTDPNFENSITDYDYDEDIPWISEEDAKQMVRFRRSLGKRNGNTITSECCKSSGCTWEEYAEYCPTNKRHTTYV